MSPIQTQFPITFFGAGSTSFSADFSAGDIVPLLGDELLANPGFEGVYVDRSGGGSGTVNVAPNWMPYNLLTDGTHTADEEAVIVHGGSKSQYISVTNVPAANGVLSEANLMPTVGWYRLSAWVYKLEGLIMRLADSGANNIYAELVTPNDEWVQLVATGRTLTENATLRIYRSAGTTRCSYYADDASAKAIDFASMLGFAGSFGYQEGTYRCHPTVAQYTQAGMAVCYADANNYLLAWVNRERSTATAYLSSMIGGVWTKSVISGAIAYLAETELELVVEADGTCTLYYNDILVGSNSVNLATLGVDAYGFTSTSTNAPGAVQGFFFDMNPTYLPDTATATRADAPLITPTYDGSGEVVHPDVYDAGAGETWNGHRYWMAVCPYPGSDPGVEFPSILVSEDRETWVEPEGITNPIVPLEGVSADPDITLAQDGKMWVVYQNNTPDKICKTVWSNDGINWSEPITLLEASESYSHHSPAVVWSGTQYYMFHANIVGPEPFQIIRRTASDIGGPWTNPTVCKFGLPAGRTFLWHIDVIRDAALGLYVAFINFDTSTSYLAFSEDEGLTWRVGASPIIARGAVGQWDRNHYRGCLVRTATGFDLWYSANDFGTPVEWRVGYTSIAWTP